MNTNIDSIKLIRLLAKDQKFWRSNIPVKFIKGNSAPKVVGRGFYYTNKSGDIIRYPSAYSAAWGKPIYHSSTIRLEVGEKFARIRKNKGSAAKYFTL